MKQQAVDAGLQTCSSMTLHLKTLQIRGSDHLRDANDEGGAGGESADDGVRQEVGEKAQPQGTQRNVNQADQYRNLRSGGLTIRLGMPTISRQPTPAAACTVKIARAAPTRR